MIDDYIPTYERGHDVLVTELRFEIDIYIRNIMLIFLCAYLVVIHTILPTGRMILPTGE